MLSLADALRALADEHDMAVLVRSSHRVRLRCADSPSPPQLTNHTVSSFGDAGGLKPALGETWKSQRALPQRMAFTSRY